MTTFKDLCNGKVSTAIQAMIDGLNEMDKNPNFEVDMDTYGEVSETVCYGCAATCAVQKLAKINFDRFNIIDTLDRSLACGLLERDLDLFEICINALRKGYIMPIWEYMGCEDEIIYPDSPLLILVNEVAPSFRREIFWKFGLRDYQEYADKLVKLGF